MTPQPNKFTISKSRHLLKTTSKAPNKENTLYTEFNSYPQTWINQRNVPQKKITRLIKVEKKKKEPPPKTKKKKIITYSARKRKGKTMITQYQHMA